MRNRKVITVMKPVEISSLYLENGISLEEAVNEIKRIAMENKELFYTRDNDMESRMDKIISLTEAILEEPKKEDAVVDAYISFEEEIDRVGS